MPVGHIEAELEEAWRKEEEEEREDLQRGASDEEQENFERQVAEDDFEYEFAGFDSSDDIDEEDWSPTSQKHSSQICLWTRVLSRP